MNRLASEKSPYLLEHAQNPVDWFAWSDAAFEEARRQNKPILLSIGYSTCHWCHVMQHESFENPEIAAILNQYFISIKVDREERPDIDQVYMASVTAMTGQGGWPLTVFLTPEKKPFYGGTYFPPYAKWGSVGFRDLLGSIAKSWQTNQQEVITSSQELVDHLRQRFEVRNEGEGLTHKALDRMYERLCSQFDPTHGGFGQAPKFPMGHTVSLLLRYWQRTGQEHALEMTMHTLNAMAAGGIFDQLGGGFHRYSTDRVWQVPHFEKMLYDQAMLVRAYCEAYQATKDEFFAETSHKTLDYVLRELTDPAGGFYCAQDADSFDDAGDKKEGAFYVWGLKDIQDLLSGQQAEIVAYYYALNPNGNAIADPQGEFVGKNILHMAHSVGEVASHFKVDESFVKRCIQDANQKMFQQRCGRRRPHLDDKILTDWNGLMISAFALASLVLREARYTTAAVRAGEFILKTMARPDGRLMHRHRDGETAVLGTLEDYAFFSLGLLDLYEAVGDLRYIQEAVKLTNQMVELFEDKNEGGFFMTGKDAHDLFVRPKESYDGAIPSGNSVAVLVLLRVYHYTSQESYLEIASRSLNCFANQVNNHPEAYAFLLTALDFLWGPVDEIVLSGNANLSPYEKMMAMIYESFRPNKVVAVLPTDEDKRKSAAEIFTPLREKVPESDGRPRFYFCRDRVCLPPSADAEAWRNILNSNQPSKKVSR
ncbi:MAG: thioredoxin domain-containing protein [Candidatus Omnitrophica bacterium]|nr:thioredoxin domain-containing protein [Candidatus Omnitrophota bacterium]